MVNRYVYVILLLFDSAFFVTVANGNQEGRDALKDYVKRKASKTTLKGNSTITTWDKPLRSQPNWHESCSFNTNHIININYV